MDLEVRWQSGRHHILGITIRSPLSEGTPRGAPPGRAAELGECLKRRQYGEAVSTIAIEPSGHMGVEALGALAQLARDAANLSSAMPGTCTPGRFRVAAARADIEAEVVCCEVAIVLVSLGGEAIQALGWAAARAQAGGPTDQSAIGAPASAGCKARHVRPATDSGGAQASRRLLGHRHPRVGTDLS